MLTIKAEPTIGSNIEKVFEEAKELAEKLNCIVDFKFNGVTCSAYRNGDTQKGVKMYHSCLKENKNYASNR